jgi:hypothetical protein
MLNILTYFRMNDSVVNYVKGRLPPVSYGHCDDCGLMYTTTNAKGRHLCPEQFAGVQLASERPQSAAMSMDDSSDNSPRSTKCDFHPQSDFDKLRSSLPVPLDGKAQELTDSVHNLQHLLEDMDSMDPYSSVTEFLLHFWHHTPPALPRNKLQLLLWILKHPSFVTSDVPGTVDQLLKLDKLLPVVKPGTLIIYVSYC